MAERVPARLSCWRILIIVVVVLLIVPQRIVSVDLEQALDILVKPLGLRQDSGPGDHKDTIVRAREFSGTERPLKQSPQLPDSNEAAMLCSQLVASPVVAEALTGAHSDTAEGKQSALLAKILAQHLHRVVILWLSLGEQYVGWQLLIMRHNVSKVCLSLPAPMQSINTLPKSLPCSRCLS